MKEKELIDIIESYGSDISRWPEEKREEALMLLDKSERAKAVFDEAKALDELLSGYETEPAREAYTNKIIDQASSPGVGGAGFHLNSSYLAYAAGIIICLLAGYLLGYADSMNADNQIYQLESILLFRDIY